MNILLQMKWIFQHDVILLIKQILKWTNETMGTYYQIELQIERSSTILRI